MAIHKPDYVLAGYWRPATIAKKWKTILPQHRAWLDYWAVWEFCRFESMDKNLRPGDVLVDVGTEQGDISSVYAQMGDGKVQMVLVEPNPDLWPNIRKTWEVNNLPLPLGCYAGLVGDQVVPASTPDFDGTIRNGWPECAWDETLFLATSFRYIHQPSARSTPQATVDALMNSMDVVPTAITIDVEGAELKVLLGAKRCLAAQPMIVYVSIHPDLLERDYGARPQDIHALMGSMGYRGKHLGTDHEQHWVYWTEARPLVV